VNLREFAERAVSDLGASPQVVAFSVVADCGIGMRIDAYSAEEHGLIVRDELDPAVVNVSLSKCLVIEGLLTSDTQFAQFDVQVLAIKAFADDPGLWGVGTTRLLHPTSIINIDAIRQCSWTASFAGAPLSSWSARRLTSRDNRRWVFRFVDAEFGAVG
jgi:hypothetical protein